MTLISDLHQQWLKDLEYQAAYEAQRPEFEIASAIIAARSQANLTQKELAELMSAKQSLIARLEAGEQNTTIKTLNRVAQATNTRLHISFLPQQTEDSTDWQRVKEMTEAEIEASAKADPDCQPTDDDFWDDAKVVKPNTDKVSQ